MIDPKTEIIALDKEFDSSTCVYFYVATITFKEKPDLKLGECEVKQ